MTQSTSSQADPTKEAELKALLDKIARREKRSYRRSLIASVIPLLIGAMSIAFLYYEGRRLRQQTQKQELQISDLNQTKEKLDGQIKDEKQEIESKKQDLSSTITELYRVRNLVAQHDPKLAKEIEVIIKAQPGAVQYTHPRISIFPSNETEEVAKYVLIQITKAGDYFVRLEKPVKNGSPNTVVRFFRRDQEVEADTIVRILKQSTDYNLRDARAKYFPGYEDKPDTNRQYGILFGPHVVGPN